MRFVLSFCILLSSFQVFAQADSSDLPPTQALEVLKYYIGRSFVKELKKSKIPPNCKIYALPFRCERDGIDTFATPLGMKISAELSFAFNRRIQKEKRLRNQNTTVISPDNTNKQLFELMAQNLTPPSTMSEESEFWKNVSNSQRPDYYLVGKYEIQGDFSSVRVSKVELIKDKLNPKLEAFADKITLRDLSFTFESEEDKAYFRKLDTRVGEIEQAYARLVRLSSKGQFAQADIIEEKTDLPIPLNDPLHLGKGYQLKVDLKQEGYLYAFYYESADLTGNKMYMIYPVENGQKNFHKKGTLILPDEESVFSPSEPPANQVFIKLIASKSKLPLQISTSPEGYKFLKAEDCLRFVSAMEKLPSAGIDSNNFIRSVE